MKKVKVIRAFLVKGERQEPGKVVEVSDALAAELIQQGRAEPAGEKSPAKRGPMSTASAPTLVGGAENAS